MADPTRPPGDTAAKLPVTAEVGGEGGSYADATVQAETFTGDHPRVDDRTTPADASETPPAEAESPAEGTRKYPTE